MRSLRWTQGVVLGAALAVLCLFSTDPKATASMWVDGARPWPASGTRRAEQAQHVIFLPGVLRAFRSLPGPQETTTPTVPPTKTATHTSTSTRTFTPTVTTSPTATCTPTATQTATATRTVTATQTVPLAADVRVAPWCTQTNAPGNDNENLNEEYVCFENRGGGPASLTGWHVRDEYGHTYTFGTFTLPAGEHVRLHSGTGGDTTTDVYWGRAVAVWNNGGDTVYLYDPGWTLVDSYHYS